MVQESCAGLKAPQTPQRTNALMLKRCKRNYALFGFDPDLPTA